MRMKGLEPPRPETLDPKSNAATNYATCAGCDCKGSNIFRFLQLLISFLARGRRGEAGLFCQFLVVERAVCIEAAAARPSPMARITVAPPRTMSPPA